LIQICYNFGFKIEIYLKFLGLTLLTDYGPMLRSDVELMARISPGPSVDVFYPQLALPLPPTIVHYSKRNCHTPEIIKRIRGA
jgi:hypothetical protein